jgi:hypothetical protein
MTTLTQEKNHVSGSWKSFSEKDGLGFYVAEHNYVKLVSEAKDLQQEFQTYLKSKKQEKPKKKVA